MDFSKLQGLIPAVIQDDETDEVLMVGFMNQEALETTRRTGFATFFSRTRNTLWTKGETSGNRLQVTRLLVDCDDDTCSAREAAGGRQRVPHRRANVFLQGARRDHLTTCRTGLQVRASPARVATNDTAGRS